MSEDVVDGRQSETRPDRYQYSRSAPDQWRPDQCQAGRGRRPVAVPCLQRVKRLEKAGFIEGYRAQLNVTRLVEHVVVFTEVTLADHRREDFIRFEREIARQEHLEEMHLISGGYDYLLKFTVRSIAQYQDLITGILDRNIGVKKYFSYIVIRTIFDKGFVPVKCLVEDTGAGPDGD